MDAIFDPLKSIAIQVLCQLQHVTKIQRLYKQAQVISLV